jgi:membrane-bound serine protease (ClpP class)
VALLGAILLAIFVVPSPWGIPLVAGGALVELGEAWAMLRWSRRRRPRVGVEAMVGRRAAVLEDGWVRVQGERWRAQAEDGPLLPGETVEVTGVDGLTLRVRRPR